MTVRQRVLDLVARQQPLRVTELGKWLPDIDHIDLDGAVTFLMRTNKISLAAGHYDLVQSKPVKSVVQPIAKAIAATVSSHSPAASPPPSAAEETAASLASPPKTSWCEGCNDNHPLSEFRLRTDSTPFKRCKKSQADAMKKPNVSAADSPASPSNRTVDAISRKRDELVAVITEREQSLAEWRARLAELDKAVGALQALVPEAFQ